MSFITLPHKKNHYFRKEFLYDTFLKTLFVLSRASDKHYFSKYWGTDAWAVPHLKFFWGPSPQFPPRSPPLYWLPVRQRMHYRLSTIVWRCVLGIAPTYLLEPFILISSCTGRQSLRPASRGDFVVLHALTAIKQHRAFSIVGPSVWNSLPSEIRSLPRDLSSSFYKLLKTVIFARAWSGSTSE